MSEHGDLIENLPTDNSDVSEDEQEVIDMIFEENKSTFEALANEIKSVAIVGLLFFVFSIPQLDSLFKGLLPITNNVYILILLKSLIVMVIYWLVKHFGYSQK